MADNSESAKLKPPPYPGDQSQNVPLYSDQPPPYYSTAMPMAPPAGWSQSGPPPPPNYGSYGSTSTNHVIISEPMMFPATQVIIVGGCPACRVGVLEDSYSCLGVLCAIFFFPLGVLCCLAMRDKQCTNCGAIF